MAGARRALARRDRRLARDRFIFPTHEDLERTHIFRELSHAEDRELLAAWVRAKRA